MLTNKEILLQFGKSITSDIVRNHVAAGQVATGDTMKAIGFTSDNNSIEITGPAHVGVLEDGRRPGKWPPVGDIIRWALAKSVINDEDSPQSKSIVFLIRRGIGQSGTKLFQKGGHSGVISNPITDDRINSLSDSILENLSNNISSQVLAGFKR